MAPLTVGVLALQGGVGEHLGLLRKAASHLSSVSPSNAFDFAEVRTAEQLARCDALVIPGGESTTMAIVARRLGLLDPLRQFVKVDCKPVWGTCAGLVMLAEEASATKKGGQDLVGGLDVRVLRNRYGTQIQSFVAELDLPFLGVAERPFRGIFIRAPVVEEIIAPPSSVGELEGATQRNGGRETNGGGGREQVEVLGVFRTGGKGEVGSSNGEVREGTDSGEDIVAVRQRNVFGTSFHPELTDDIRIHVWWLKQVLDAVKRDLVIAAA